MKQKVKIVQEDENEIPVEIIAQSIVDIGKAMKKISESRLNRSALITLIAFDTKLPRTTVTNVLNSLDSLSVKCLKPLKK